MSEKQIFTFFTYVYFFLVDPSWSKLTRNKKHFVIDVTSLNETSTINFPKKSLLIFNMVKVCVNVSLKLVILYQKAKTKQSQNPE